ncbi:MAG: flavodoxin family protein, partial [Chloroflexi bacterium]|nr:flavodoxin family protein [Chloroflexota bacterium]
IEDCRGCFHCLRTGRCAIPDEMDGIVERMLAADGLVVGSPVRNGNVTALYKRFYERITYRLGFPLLMEDKQVLAIASVGFAGGKALNRRLLGLQATMHARLAGWLFFRVGIPARVGAEELRPRLTAAADRLVAAIAGRRGRGLGARLAYGLDRLLLPRLLFAKSPELYAHVLARWREKGYLA